MPLWTASWLQKLRSFLPEEMSKSELQEGLGLQEPTGASKIVVLLADNQDRKLLSRLADEQHWTLYYANTCGEAWDLLNQTHAPIALCDRDLPATDWPGVVQMMASAPHKTYTILLSKVADDYLWNEVIRHGGHDLLATPLAEEKVLRAIRLAISWNNSVRLQAMLIKHYL